jgi:hypothetical protein
MFNPYKILLNLVSAYMFVITSVHNNLISSPLSLFSLLLLLNKPRKELTKKEQVQKRIMLDRITVIISTGLIIFSIIHQNFV